MVRVENGTVTYFYGANDVDRRASNAVNAAFEIYEVKAEDVPENVLEAMKSIYHDGESVGMAIMMDEY